MASTENGFGWYSGRMEEIRNPSTKERRTIAKENNSPLNGRAKTDDAGGIEN